MGLLIYGSESTGIEFPDRTLAHLQMVIMSKLRRAESFGFSFEHEISPDSGRAAIWLSPPIPLQFIYASREDIPINRAWLELLATSSNSVAGLRLIPEPTADVAAEREMQLAGNPRA